MNRAAHEREPADDELVRRARGGEPSAFVELVSRYQDRVYNTCYRMCHREADALDLTQATFLKALEALDRYEGRASFYTWLFRIAVNLAISDRRKKQRRREVSVDAPNHERRINDPPAPPAAEDGSHAAERSELQVRLAAALDQLDEEFRVAVVLKDIEDMDYATIAEILEVPVGTVKSRIHRARTTLRGLLTEHVENEDAD